MRAGPGSSLTLDQAYQAAFVWLVHAGEPPSEVTERGPQAVELRSRGMTAFVRVPERPVNQRTVLAVLATEAADRQRVIFSVSGFTPAAISIAEAQGIPLFTLERDGRATPQNGRAAGIVPDGAAPVPFETAQPDGTERITAANWGRTEFSADEWIDCPGCGVNQHISLDACRLCGTPLAADSAPDGAPGEVVYRCRGCGSRDVEVVTDGDAILQR